MKFILQRTGASRRLILILGLSALGLIAQVLRAQSFDEDFRVWNEFMWRQYSDELWTTYLWSELRWTEDASELGTWVVQQKAYYRLGQNFQLGGGGAWIEAKRGDGSWNRLARFELELNRRWKLSEITNFALRNRLETRWWKSRGDQTEFVSRHRFRISRQANWFGSMERFEVSNEIFLDYSGEGVNENRFRPINLFFKISYKASTNLFFQVRSRRLDVDRNWEHAYILGAGLRLR